MTRIRARKGASIEERLRLHMITAPSGCWIWLGATSRVTSSNERYPRMGLNGKSGYAHRISYETFVGPIPDGLHLDHLCRRPRCIRPLHLQPVTPQVNMRRGTSPGARAQRRDQCLRGHAYSEHRVQWGGRSYCRPCMKANHQRYAERMRAATTAARQEQLADLIAYRDRELASA